MRNITLFIFSALILISCNRSEIVYNAGIGGNTTNDLLKRMNKDVIEKQPDMVIIMVGTNDMLNSKKMISYHEYMQNLEKIVTVFKQKKIDVVLCSPPTVDTTYLFERHDRRLFTEEPNIKLDSVSQIMKEISIKENLYFIDLHSAFQGMNLPSHNLDNYIRNEKNSQVKDGVHPTSLGYSLIADTIFDFLKERDLINRKVRIVCFGDSITFGIGVEGEGTSEGKTYPAFLKKKIIKTFANIFYVFSKKITRENEGIDYE